MSRKQGTLDMGADVYDIKLCGYREEHYHWQWKAPDGEVYDMSKVGNVLIDEEFLSIDLPPPNPEGFHSEYHIGYDVTEEEAQGVVELWHEYQKAMEPMKALREALRGDLAEVRDGKCVLVDKDTGKVKGELQGLETAENATRWKSKTSAKQRCLHPNSTADIIEGVIQVSCEDCGFSALMSPDEYQAMLDAMEPPEPVVRKFPFEIDPRVQTGAIQFKDDWPGLFVRGDSALHLAISLDQAVKDMDDLVKLAGANKIERFVAREYLVELMETIFDHVLIRGHRFKALLQQNLLEGALESGVAVGAKKIEEERKKK